LVYVVCGVQEAVQVRDEVGGLGARRGPRGGGVVAEHEEGVCVLAARAV
jgi:hypothetical protein